MAELFDKTILSISCLFVITLTIYILFSDDDDDDDYVYDDDEYDDDMEGFQSLVENEDNEYATFYGTTEGFSFTGDYEEDDTIIEGLRGSKIGRQFKDFGKNIKDVGKK